MRSRLKKDNLDKEILKNYRSVANIPFLCKVIIGSLRSDDGDGCENVTLKVNKKKSALNFMAPILSLLIRQILRNFLELDFKGLYQCSGK